MCCSWVSKKHEECILSSIAEAAASNCDLDIGLLRNELNAAIKAPDIVSDDAESALNCWVVLREFLLLFGKVLKDHLQHGCAGN